MDHILEYEDFLNESKFNRAKAISIFKKGIIDAIKVIDTEKTGKVNLDGPEYSEYAEEAIIKAFGDPDDEGNEEVRKFLNQMYDIINDIGAFDDEVTKSKIISAIK